MSKALSNTPNEIVTEIIMTRTASRNQTILIVEGSTEKSLLSSHIIKECKIVPTNGKDKVLVVFVILEKRSIKGVLGIIDADFAYLEEINAHPNLFFTDTSDLEMLLLSSRALETVLFNTISPELNIEKICEQVRKHALDIAKSVAYLRWVDYNNRQYNISFNKISFNELIDLKNFQFDEEKMLLVVTQDASIRENIQAEIAVLKKQTINLWILCRGHDVLGIIAIILPQIVKNVSRFEMSDKHKIQTKAGELSRSLRMSFDSSFFKETKLYQTIKQWEQDNPPFVVFK
jgi:hypothetical protein